jgi:hypothetical protein
VTTNFETAKAELRKLGLTLTQRPGEYVVNFINGTESTAHIAPDLDDALEHGRQMATAAAATPAAAPGKKYRRPRRMTPKAQRRRMIRQHNRRMRARAIRQNKTNTDDKI